MKQMRASKWKTKISTKPLKGITLNFFGWIKAIKIDNKNFIFVSSCDLWNLRLPEL